MNFDSFYVDTRDNDNVIEFICYYLEYDGNVDHQLLNILMGKQCKKPCYDATKYVEIGPKLSMMTPWCSNALSIFRKCDSQMKVSRIERTFLINKNNLTKYEIDPMLESIYDKPLKSFPKHDKVNEVLYYVDNIKKENVERSLGFDSQDLEYYENMFKVLGRRPTNIELHDLAQSNSEHSRHWFFRGKLFDKQTGKTIDKSLFDIIKETQKYTNYRSVIAFSDNASAIYGFNIQTCLPIGRSYLLSHDLMHITFTAETHNFPTGIAPFPGANTGTGGRIRDTHAIGRGGYVNTGVVGYCVGNISNSKFVDKNIKTLLRASDGASDYGNKFGEPVILGFCRDYGLTNGLGERIEWVKPIMFSGGIGQIRDRDLYKNDPNSNMLVVKIGGPCYKIGVGGGTASSRDQDIKNIKEDLSAVQRGDPEMENKLNRLIRACIELPENVIQSIHDQGAGGTGNVTKEIVYPGGANINLDLITMGDKSLNSLEKWISEYQEQDTILVLETDIDTVKNIGIRESIDVNVIGKITNNGKITVESNNKIVVDLNLDDVLGNNMKMKTYELVKVNVKLDPLKIPFDPIVNHLIRIFGLVGVGSKRFLTNKVDRSVTGLVAQQSCVGPYHTPLSNYGITAQSHFVLTGSVVAIGERPTIGQIDTGAMARMSVAEMLTNMVFAQVSCLSDCRCSGNWMWPLGKLGEKWELYNACKAMCEFMNKLGIALDGGKDSLSMVYKDGQNVIVGPRQLVITGYAPTPNIMNKVTPNFKNSGGSILYIDLANKKKRLGGSALAQVYDQIGDSCPDIEEENIELLKNTFIKIQHLMKYDKIKAGHDISDGGFVTTLCEMSFSSGLGLNVQIDEIHKKGTPLASTIFSEELGLIIEVISDEADNIMKFIGKHCYNIGKTTKENRILVSIESTKIIDAKLTDLRNVWESKSFELDSRQCNPKCVKEEQENMDSIYKLKYSFRQIKYDDNDSFRPVVALIRDEGSNGDREMAAAFHMAGFLVRDLCINDFINNTLLTLESYQGIAFVGGFSYSDVFGAGLGWYAVIQSNKRIRKVFDDFYNRSDTFSIGVCNGCQLMSLLNWIPSFRMVSNESGRFESRFPSVQINKTESIMLKNMDGSVLGIWVAHGQGKFVIDDHENLSIAIQYVDPSRNNQVTNRYPFNPNGSDMGVAAVTSKNGRHLAMMPHPERSFLAWQIPTDTMLQADDQYVPWLSMFKNAYVWTKCNAKCNP